MVRENVECDAIRWKLTIHDTLLRCERSSKQYETHEQSLRTVTMTEVAFETSSVAYQSLR